MTWLLRWADFDGVHSIFWPNPRSVQIQLEEILTSSMEPKNANFENRIRNDILHYICICHDIKGGEVKNVSKVLICSKMAWLDIHVLESFWCTLLRKASQKQSYLKTNCQLCFLSAKMLLLFLSYLCISCHLPSNWKAPLKGGRGTYCLV